jgi:hypothetical protein
VWAESRSIAAVIEDMCRELAVSLYPSGGFTSLTLAHQSAEWINETTGQGEIPATVIYVGDYDPAGVLIDKKIEAELRTHLHPDVYMDFRRVAITPSQIIAYDLPTKARKAGERRAPHITETVEAEAMPAHVMRELIRSAVNEYLPPGALEAITAAEDSERDMLRSIAGALLRERPAA